MTKVSPVLASACQRFGIARPAPLPGGTYGACLGIDHDGSLVVIKELPQAPVFAYEKVLSAVVGTTRLREGGYPATHYLRCEADGAIVFTVQRYIPGQKAAQLDESAISQLLDVHCLQLGVLPEGRHRMIAQTYDSQVLTRASRLAIEARRTPTRLGGRLLTLLGMIKTAAAKPRVADLVHNDFHHNNLLRSTAGDLTVIDWEGATAGDCRSDLIRLYLIGADADKFSSVARKTLESVLLSMSPQDFAYLGARRLLEDVAFAWGRPAETAWVLRTSEAFLRLQGRMMR